MDKIIIQGGRRLQGDIKNSGAKNAALPIIAASLLTKGWNAFHNIPDLVDIKTIKKLMASFGVVFADDHDALLVNAENIQSCLAAYDLVRTMRASVLVLGPLVARTGEAHVSLPGGCAIGARPVNLHIRALQDMGAEVELKDGYVIAKARRLKGAEIYFDIVTVTGTENIMMAASLADGVTVLKNAAREPEVVNLAEILKGMGARITGAGTDVIRIDGVSELYPVEGTIISDRIEAGTFMIAAGITGGDVRISNCHPGHHDALIAKLRDTGMEMIVGNDYIRAIGRERPRSVDIKTIAYPGFPTDLQAQIMSLMTVASGLSVITETIFENRFMHVSELMRLGAEILVQGSSAIVKGVPTLHGAPVMATDLRASASLILAGLAAAGRTELSRVYHLDRGYERIEEKISHLGAAIERVKA